MFFLRIGPILSRWSGGDSTCAAVVADAVYCRIVDHRGVVCVVNVGDVHVIHRTVVFELSVIPATSFIALTAVAEAIIDPAIEADVRTPVAFIEGKGAAVPTPVTGGPEITGLRSHDPRARHEEVTVRAVGPVARRPEIALSGEGGCSYTGSAGGPIVMDMPICANAAADMASITSANNIERIEGMKRIVFPLA